MGVLISVVMIGSLLGLAIRQHRAERNNPFPAAFSTTFVAILLIVPGLLGYELHKSDWSFMRLTVSDGPVWWQIYLGLLFVPPAMYFWRKAIRALS